MRHPRRRSDQTDEELVRRLSSGESPGEALSTLYDRYGRTVYGSGIKLLGSGQSAEELVQEVFLKVWRSAGTFDPSRSSFSTWLYRITRSVAADMYRRQSRNPATAAGEDIAEVRDASSGPQEIVDDSWLTWRVLVALEELDEPHREVLRLAYFEGLTQREISERTGLPLGTVKSRTLRALKKLRAGLGLAGISREVL